MLLKCSIFKMLPQLIEKLPGKLKREWQDSDTILAYFARRRGEAILGYNQFVEQGIMQGKRKELVVGGLIRSFWGWS
ncbi:MAG: hypothetical protein J7K02_12085 [Deltaproteobacteria bacterium]|nr:hypothetical protein [Deltaproteobacteria bacterium]